MSIEDKVDEFVLSMYKQNRYISVFCSKDKYEVIYMNEEYTKIQIKEFKYE